MVRSSLLYKSDDILYKMTSSLYNTLAKRCQKKPKLSKAAKGELAQALSGLEALEDTEGAYNLIAQYKILHSQQRNELYPYKLEQKEGEVHGDVKDLPDGLCLMLAEFIVLLQQLQEDEY